MTALGPHGRQETVTLKFAQLIANGLTLANGPSALNHVAGGLNEESGQF